MIDDTAMTDLVPASFFPHGVTIRRRAWGHYTVTEAMDAATHAPLERTRFARLLCHRLNEARPSTSIERPPAVSGDFLAMMTLHDIFRYIVLRYCVRFEQSAMEHQLAVTAAHCGENSVNDTLSAFVTLYPSVDVHAGTLSADTLANKVRSATSERDQAALETIILQLAHENPALAPFYPLFDHADLCAAAPYAHYIQALEDAFRASPPVPETNAPLFATLRSPILASPYSLQGQLAFILERWRAFLPQYLYKQLLFVQDTLREETLMRGPGPGPVSAMVFGSDAYAEPEAFSPDLDWMPKVVLMAKLAYVWLDQLSRKYGRRLHLLSDIPDAELAQLARWGFNALWLIGVWERSPASRTIKRLMGNPEAAASAYSLYDYAIAADLGGDIAFHDLAERAWRFGIRLAGDMVPNHMGLYSRWVVEHPDRFLQLCEPPFPGYRYTGPDLSSDDRIGLYIEDGYWTHSDAAVVFKRVDRHTGETRYLYHGNDGTSMPWNDTAQLNFMLQETREAVIQTILHVAKKFPIIRFDAAMTLAKRHYQRLWFPKPGDGGAIPSRAEHGMSREDFERAFPVEFWREVVDRVAAEAPGTLLLAEAFWLMEGYFVRTLGMHRVYNSAFMNMLKMEDNAKYRQTIKNVLEFSPEVLQRFVNFMNNPDEDTAEAQFGKGDKYFGAATLLATMPGLPMFGHGQIEGFTEKYGMEYRRAYREESADTEFVARHEREVFPLLRKRFLFSSARHFALYDFITQDGWVDENVFAYSNRSGTDRALVVYNNAYTTTRGILHLSTVINEGQADAKHLVRKNIADALALRVEPEYYSICRDIRTGLEYLHHNRTVMETGVSMELPGYGCKVLLDWQEIRDTNLSWGRLHAKLSGKGVPSIAEAYLEMNLAMVLAPFRELVRYLAQHFPFDEDTVKTSLSTVHRHLKEFLISVTETFGLGPDVKPALEAAMTALQRLQALQAFPVPAGLPETVAAFLRQGIPDPSDTGRIQYWQTLAFHALLAPLGTLAATATGTSMETAVSGQASLPSLPLHPEHAPEKRASGWMREWLLNKQLADILEQVHGDSWRAGMAARFVYVCAAYRSHLMALESRIWGPLLYAWFEDRETQALLMLNHYGGRRWINREQLRAMLYGMVWSYAIELADKGKPAVDALCDSIANATYILDAAGDTGYDLDLLLESLK